MSIKIFSGTADQTIANTTTETTLFGTGVGNLTLPASFWFVGRQIRIRLAGTIATTLTPTADIKLKYGSTVLLDSTALALPVLTGTNPWKIEATITCRSTGASGSVGAEMDIELTSGGVVVGAALKVAILPVAPTTIDTTSASALDVTFTWGTASALDTITTKTALVEFLN